MQSFWQVLGLDPLSCAEKDIKSAYARLIRVHRPDTDPLGFQKVREAYEGALQARRDKGRAEQPEPQRQKAPLPEAAAGVQTEAQPDAPVASVSVVQAEAAVTSALEAGVPGAVTRAIGSLLPACCAAGVIDRAAIRQWQQSLHRVTGGRADLVAMGVSVSQLMGEMQCGASLITHACVTSWEAEQKGAVLLQLAEAMVAEPARLTNADAAVVALRLALEFGFSRPSLAQSLVNLAFPYLDRSAREQFVPEVERQGQAGQVFASLRADQFDFWRARFRRPGGDWNWHDPASEAAIEYLVAACGRTWPGLAMLQPLVPADWWQRLQDALHAESTALVRERPKADVLPAHPPAPAAGAPARRSWRRVAAILVIAAGSAIMLWNSDLVRRHASPVGITSIDGQGTWSAADEGGKARLPGMDSQFAEGMAACDLRLRELREHSVSAANWVSVLQRMFEQAEVKFTPQGKPMPERVEAFRQTVQTFFKGISRAEADPNVERDALELVLLDPETARLLKTEAMRRQQDICLPSMFLPIWQQVARSSSEGASLVADVAGRLLNEEGRGIAFDASDREVLRLLAHKPALSSATGQAIPAASSP